MAELQVFVHFVAFGYTAEWELIAWCEIHFILIRMKLSYFEYDYGFIVFTNRVPVDGGHFR